MRTILFRAIGAAAASLLRLNRGILALLLFSVFFCCATKATQAQSAPPTNNVNKNNDKKNNVKKGTAKQPPRVQTKSPTPTTPLQQTFMTPTSEQFAYPDSLARLRFERYWNKVDSCLRRNLPKSALAVVDSVEADARRYGVAAEAVKSLLYKAALQAEVRDDGESVFAADMRRAIQEADANGRALHATLLRSALADFFFGISRPQPLADSR